jgi:hypothetical protein
VNANHPWFRTGIAVAVLTCALAGGAFAQTLLEDLRRSIGAIARGEAALNAGGLDTASVEEAVRTLTRLLDDPAMKGEVAQAVARFWRGRGTHSLNKFRLDKKQAPDAALATQTLADYDSVIAFGRDVPQAGVTIGNALYGAGSILRNMLDSVPQAYGYWERCAKLEHAGCLNIMASAKLTGAGGVKVDLPGSIALHKVVYDTGTDYNCAGIFSAVAIAEVLYFGAVKDVTVSDLDWLQRAQALVKQLEKERNSPYPCGHVLAVTEYLMRLDRGDDQPRLLATEGVKEAEVIATYNYVAGRMPEREFRALASKEKTKDGACRMFFAAYWLAEIRSDKALAVEYRRSMTGLGGDHCGNELALAKLKYGP